MLSANSSAAVVGPRDSHDLRCLVLTFVSLLWLKKVSVRTAGALPWVAAMPIAGPSGLLGRSLPKLSGLLCRECSRSSPVTLSPEEGTLREHFKPYTSGKRHRQNAVH